MSRSAASLAIKHLDFTNGVATSRTAAAAAADSHLNRIHNTQRQQHHRRSSDLFSAQLAKLGARSPAIDNKIRDRLATKDNVKPSTAHYDKPKLLTSYGVFVRDFFERHSSSGMRFSDAARNWSELDARQRRIYEASAKSYNREQIIQNLTRILRRYKFTMNPNTRRTLRNWLTTYCKLPKRPLSPYLLFCSEKVSKKPQEANKDSITGAKSPISGTAPNFFCSDFSKAWQKLSPMVKEFYKEKYTKNFRTYKRLHDRILRQLERKQFEDFVK